VSIAIGIGLSLTELPDMISGPGAGPGAGVDNLLLETGDALLLETGDALLLE